MVKLEGVAVEVQVITVAVNMIVVSNRPHRPA